MGIIIGFYESSGFIYIFYILHEISNLYTEAPGITDDSSSNGTGQPKEGIEGVYIVVFIEMRNKVGEIFSCRYLEKAIS